MDGDTHKPGGEQRARTAVGEHALAALAVLVRKLLDREPAGPRPHEPEPARPRPHEPEPARPTPHESELAPILDPLIRLHFLAPLAYRAGLVRFREDYIASALLAEVRGRTLTEATGALAQAGIPVILLKGISYAGTLYPDPAERPMSDIDLLVPPQAHADACRVLRRLGYWWAGGPEQRSSLQHAMCFRRKGAAIDLHRAMMQQWRTRMAMPDLWRRARPASEHGPGILRLDPVDETVVHLAHMARHELRVPIINYVDAARLVAQVPGGRSALMERAREFRLARAIQAALAMTHLLASPAPAEQSSRLPLSWPWTLVQSRLPSLLQSRLPSLLPSEAELLAYTPVPRSWQLVRKAWLVDGPAELAGLALTTAYSRLVSVRARQK